MHDHGHPNLGKDRPRRASSVKKTGAMVPESTLDELETATVAAHHCVNCIVFVKSNIGSLRVDEGSKLFAETIREPTRMLLEGYRALRAALKPHVDRDFVGVCVAPVEIGGMFSTSAHNSVFNLSNRVLYQLSFVLMPAGYWPSTEDPETDLLSDLRLEKPVEVSEKAVMSLRTVFDELSHKELSKCTAMVGREWATARAQFPRTTIPAGVSHETNIDGSSDVQGSAMLLDPNGSNEVPAKPKPTAKEREAAFDDAISGYSDSDWKRDKNLNNKAWRVRKKQQAGELFGAASTERGWYQAKTKKRAIKKDIEGVWVYLTVSHSQKLKDFFSAFN